MFKKILLGTDFSPALDNLLYCLDQLRAMGAEEVVLAHIVYVANTPGLENGLISDAKPQMEEVKNKLEEAGFKVKTELFLGKPAHSLVELANKHDVDLTLVGSHGYGTLTSLTLGGVSEKLLNLSKKPVFLSRVKKMDEGQEKAVDCGKIFHRILFPTDFSDTSEMAFECLKVFVEHAKCNVDLITVRSSDTDGSALEDLKKIDRSRMLRMKQDLENRGASNVEIIHETGDAADVIVEASREFSLIVMGIQGQGLAKRILLGSVAQEVAQKAEVPILFIPAHCLYGVAN